MVGQGAGQQLLCIVLVDLEPPNQVLEGLERGRQEQVVCTQKGNRMLLAMCSTTRGVNGSSPTGYQAEEAVQGRVQLLVLLGILGLTVGGEAPGAKEHL